MLRPGLELSFPDSESLIFAVQAPKHQELIKLSRNSSRLPPDQGSLGVSAGRYPACGLFEVRSHQSARRSLLTAYDGLFPGSLLLLAPASAFFFSSASARLNKDEKGKDP